MMALMSIDSIFQSLDVLLILILSFLGIGADDPAEVERKKHRNLVSKSGKDHPERYVAEFNVRIPH